MYTLFNKNDVSLHTRISHRIISYKVYEYKKNHTGIDLFGQQTAKP